ncbi:tetratricopeptide repeat protein, partial [Candidatus Riflebacteria bacterium]
MKKGLFFPFFAGVICLLPLPQSNNSSFLLSAQEIFLSEQGSRSSTEAKSTHRAFKEILSKSRFAFKKAYSYELLSRAYAKRNLFTQARQQAEKGLKIEPYNTSLRNLYGFILTKLGKVEDGIEQFRFVLNIDPKNIYAKKALQDINSQVRQPILKSKTMILYSEQKRKPAPTLKKLLAFDARISNLKNPYYIDLNAKKTCCLA